MTPGELERMASELDTNASFLAGKGSKSTVSEVRSIAAQLRHTNNINLVSSTKLCEF